MSHASPTSVNPTDAHWANASSTGCTRTDATNCSDSRMRIPYRIADYNWGCCNERNSYELREMKDRKERERELRAMNPNCSRLPRSELTICAINFRRQSCTHRAEQRVGIFFDCFRRIMDRRIVGSQASELPISRHPIVNLMRPANPFRSMKLVERNYHSWRG